MDSEVPKTVVLSLMERWNTKRKMFARTIVCEVLQMATYPEGDTQQVY